MRERRFTPVLLLLAVVAGLLTMHTVGHVGSHAAAAHSVAAASPAKGHGSADHAPMSAAVADLGADVVQKGGSPALPGDLTALCMAILSAIATIVAALILLRRRRQPTAAAFQLGGAVAAGSRAPPRPGIGLLIADLSVLRN